MPNGTLVLHGVYSQRACDSTQAPATRPALPTACFPTAPTITPTMPKGTLLRKPKSPPAAPGPTPGTSGTGSRTSPSKMPEERLSRRLIMFTIYSTGSSAAAKTQTAKARLPLRKLGPFTTPLRRPRRLPMRCMAQGPS